MREGIIVIQNHVIRTKFQSVQNFINLAHPYYDNKDYETAYNYYQQAHTKVIELIKSCEKLKKRAYLVRFKKLHGDISCDAGTSAANIGKIDEAITYLEPVPKTCILKSQNFAILDF